MEKILYSITALIVGLSLGFALGEFNGKSIGKEVQKAKINTAVIEGNNRHDQKEQQIRSLDNDALVRRYCRWVYDLPYDQCVKETVPVE